jgi:hypothetical protein
MREYADEASRLMKENIHLRDELGAYFKQSVASRPVFADLSDATGRYTRSELQGAIVDFVLTYPMHLSDGEIVLIAPLMAAANREYARLRKSMNEIDEKTFDSDSAKLDARAEITQANFKVDESLREKLVPILGPDRVAIYFKDWERPDPDSR